MINGHGDDLHLYPNVQSNFSSNIYAGFSHEGLFAHLQASMPLITSYPEPSSLSLERHIAQLYGLEEPNVMVTNGATEAIYLLAQAWQGCQSSILTPTFSEYADACRMHGHEVTLIPHLSSLPFHPSPLTPHLAWLCVPNNPTGHVVPKQELLHSISAHPDTLYVIDASYAAYTQQPVLSPAEAVAHANVLMLCSMTKDYGVPGLRLGYLVGSDRLLGKVRTLRMPWSVNALAIQAGHYLLSHQAHYRIPLAMLLAERQRVEHHLQAMGITTQPSHSHMLLCRLPHGQAIQLKQYLAHEHGILIRDASNFESLTAQHFRIAVQTEAQNTQLLNAIDLWMQS